MTVLDTKAAVRLEKAFLKVRRKVENMDELTHMLNNVSDSYYDFVVAVLSYAKKKEHREKAVSEYMMSNPDAKSSDILLFVSEQEDFYEDNLAEIQPEERD